MGAGGDTGLMQDRGRQQSAKPRGMLQHRYFVPGIQRNDGLQHRRQILDLSENDPPFLQPRVLVPVKIIDQCILFRRDGNAGTLRHFDGRIRSREHRIDGGIVNTRQADFIIAVLFFPFGLDSTRGACRQRVISAIRSPGGCEDRLPTTPSLEDTPQTSALCGAYV